MEILLLAVSVSIFVTLLMWLNTSRHTVQDQRILLPHPSVCNPALVDVPSAAL